MMLGLGISSPRQDEDAHAVGAAGAIAGSAVVKRIAQHRDSWPMLERELSDFLLSMKEATKGRLIRT